MGQQGEREAPPDLQVLTTPQVAKILNTSERTVQRLIRLGRLKGQKVGRGYRVRFQDLKAFFEQGPSDDVS